MKEAGQVVLFEFPRGDLREGKLRPALLLNNLPGAYDTWLICMISSQVEQKVEEFDDIVSKEDNDFKKAGLKTDSLIRLGRLAVVDKICWKVQLAKSIQGDYCALKQIFLIG